MTHYHATRDLILTYFRVVGEPRTIGRVIRYMKSMHKVQPGATRSQVYRLCNEGLIARVGPGLYQLKQAQHGKR